MNDGKIIVGQFPLCHINRLIKGIFTPRTCITLAVDGPRLSFYDSVKFTFQLQVSLSCPLSTMKRVRDEMGSEFVFVSIRAV